MLSAIWLPIVSTMKRRQLPNPPRFKQPAAHSPNIPVLSCENCAELWGAKNESSILIDPLDNFPLIGYDTGRIKPQIPTLKKDYAMQLPEKYRPAMQGKSGRCAGFPDVRCECGGQLAIDGEGYVQLPTGLGFAEVHGKAKFVVDALRYPAYSGWCMKCHKKGMFIRTDREPRSIRNVPRGINQRISAARKGV